MLRSVANGFVVAGAVMALGGCATPTSEDTRSTGMVTGVVSSLSGNLPTVTVRATAYAPSCQSGHAVGSGIAATSVPDGRYTMNVVSIEPPQPACIVVVAVRTVNGQRDSVLSGPVSLQLRNDSDPQDTAHVSLILP